MEENKITQKINKEKIKNLLIRIKECLTAAIIGISAGMIINYFFGVIIISGESMTNTLSDGEIGITVKRFNKYERGDIVVARMTVPETGSISVIKRIIAISGDTIEIKGNIVYVNGKEIKEKYIKEDMDTKDIEIYLLKPGEYFIMGDNRNNSFDSRLYGVVKYEQLDGELIFHVHPRSLAVVLNK